MAYLKLQLFNNLKVRDFNDKIFWNKKDSFNQNTINILNNVKPDFKDHRWD